MALRLASLYIRLLGILAVASLAITIAVHIFAIIGFQRSIVAVVELLWLGVVAITLLVMPFVKDSLFWLRQVKLSPRWIWKGALLSAAYAVAVLLASMFRLEQVGSPAVLLSAILLPFVGISLCIVHSVTHDEGLSDADGVKAMRNSVLVGASVVLLASARHFHLLPHR